MARGKHAAKAARKRAAEAEQELQELRAAVQDKDKQIQELRAARRSEEVMAKEVQALRKQVADGTSEKLDDLQQRYDHLMAQVEEVRAYRHKLQKYWEKEVIRAVFILGSGIEGLQRFAGLLGGDYGEITLDLISGRAPNKDVVRAERFKAERSGYAATPNMVLAKETMEKLRKAGVLDEDSDE